MPNRWESRWIVLEQITDYTEENEGEVAVGYRVENGLLVEKWHGLDKVGYMRTPHIYAVRLAEFLQQQKVTEAWTPHPFTVPHTILGTTLAWDEKGEDFHNWGYVQGMERTHEFAQAGIRLREFDEMPPTNQ